MTYKYLHIRRELQKERFQKILSFADENITKCSLLSLERLSSDELEKGECGVEDPKLFAQKFATIIERHITSWKPDMAIALEFRHHITFESNDTVWYFEFDWGKEDISGVIDYRFPNDRDVSGIIILDNQGSRMILYMIEEAFNKYDVKKTGA